MMDTSVYFEKISEKISKHLEAATHDILIAEGDIECAVFKHVSITRSLL